MRKAQVTAEKTAWLEIIAHAQSHLTSPKARARYDRTLLLEAEESFDAVTVFALQGGLRRALASWSVSTPGRAQPLPQEPGHRGRLARDALAGLNRCPPDAPTGLEMQVLRDRVRLSWTPPPPDGLGPLTFAVMRKRGGLPPASRRRHKDRRGLGVRIRRPAPQAGRDHQLCRARQAWRGGVHDRRRGWTARLSA